MPFDAAHFVTIDRQDETSRVGVEGSKLLLSSGQTTQLRFDVHGQWLDPGSGAGVYLSAPVSYASAGDSESGRQTALGDIELGGTYLPRVMESNVAIVVHAGLTLPTQDEPSSNNAFRNGLSRVT